MSVGLILIDIQNDYFAGGAMELVGMEAAAANARRVLESFRESGKPVFHVQHISARPEAGFFLPDTAGCEIHEDVSPAAGESVIQKNYPNSFQNTELAGELEKKGIDELVVCGAMTHMCIDTFVRSAFERGYKLTLLGDACATRDLEYNGEVVSADSVQAAFLAAIGSVFANVCLTDDFLKENM